MLFPRRLVSIAIFSTDLCDIKLTTYITNDPHLQLTTLAGKNTKATSKLPGGMPASVAKCKKNTASPHKNSSGYRVALENAMAEAVNFCYQNRLFARAALKAGKSRGLR
jgi:hypothetical protein